MMEPFYPFRFKPVYKHYIWGGRRIPDFYNRGEPDGIYAESWEISTHPDGETKISNGSLAGKTLSDLLPLRKEELLGSAVKEKDFPLLIKLIDAREVLSVQVHPNERSAAKTGGDPKTEMWYFLEGDGSSRIYCGLVPGTKKADFENALSKKKIDTVLRSVPAVKGSAVYVPGGQVHAIGEGCLLLEIQQNSNTTYRVYDWDRSGPDGKPRELHLEKAMQAIEWDESGDPRCAPDRFSEDGIEGTRIKESPFFRLDRFELCSETAFQVSNGAAPAQSFHALFFAEGNGTLAWDGGQETVRPGESWLIPAALPAYTLSPAGRKLTLLRTTVP